MANTAKTGLMVIAAVLFVIDLFVPDPLPFVDEIILGVTTLLLARRRDRPPGGPS